MVETRTPHATRAFREKWTENIVLLDPRPKRSIQEVFAHLSYLAKFLCESPTNLEIQLGEKWYFPQLKRGSVEITSGKFDDYSSIGIVSRAFKGERADVSFLAGAYFESGRFKVHFPDGRTDIAGIRHIISHLCSAFSFSLGYYWRMQNDHSPLSFGGTVINLSKLR